MLEQLKQQIMLPQIVIGSLETGFNYLIKRSNHCLPTLKKLKGNTLQIQLLQPDFDFVIAFSESQTDWLSHYEAKPDCHIVLHRSALPKLANKSKLTELINNKTIVLNGDIQVLQHFMQLLDELEKNPAELLSPFIGDVVAQSTTEITKTIFNKISQHTKQTGRQMTDNFTNESLTLVHPLEMVNFCDEVTALEQKVKQFETKLYNKKGI
ncbi:MAG: hypothetical protein CR960_00550 [Pasteurellales bacterium]|nr:MAG: hypothetical protein CR960_00550 [Pasteurellales bacterium]